MKPFPRIPLLVGLACVSLLQSTSAQIIFSDDFESGLGNWTATGTSPLTISTTRNAVPGSGTQSALIDSSLDSMYHNIGQELAGYFSLSYYLYDDGTATRAYAESRGYTGAGYNDGGLQQLYAAGTYTSVTAAGEVFDATVYQGRITAGSFAGWFNLNLPGVAGRSVGWHQFTIVRQADGTTVDFYVDGTLGRTITGATDFSMDSLRIGSVAAGTSVYDVNLDGIQIDLTVVPEPATWALLGLGALGLAGRLWRRRR